MVILMNKKRLRRLQKGKEQKGSIVYWMSRDQRVNDNWALIYGYNQALKNKSPLIVYFTLVPQFKEATYRIYKFMLEGLNQVSQKLESLNIAFVLKLGYPEILVPQFIEENGISLLITDFSPLRIKQTWNERIKEKISIPFYEVDAHNIIPVWEVSSKKEYAAYTLRKKIEVKIGAFLEEFPKLKKLRKIWSENTSPIEWKKLLNKVEVQKTEFIDTEFKPGEENAMRILQKFLKEKLTSYNKTRNDPKEEGTSDLSPYLHFGHISSQRVVLEASKIKNVANLKNSFYDEIIVRKELSDNFCFYEPKYDSFEGFHSWAQETLNTHRNDTREYIYKKEEFENAKTHDDAWNAAQIEMKTTGKMQGYMRMYWGKKILEWTQTPEEALQIAIFLNNKYELDGRDPNGYTGIAWSIGGIHDRAWKERPIYGKIRYMSYNGLKRKFELQKYIKTYL
jgi:deoxyribodipyrimidine photo-lyase